MTEIYPDHQIYWNIICYSDFMMIILKDNWLSGFQSVTLHGKASMVKHDLEHLSRISDHSYTLLYVLTKYRIYTYCNVIQYNILKIFYYKASGLKNMLLHFEHNTVSSIIIIQSNVQ